MNDEKKEPTREKKDHTRLWAIADVILAACLLVLLLLGRCGRLEVPPADGVSVVSEDPSAVPGSWEQRDPAEIEAELNSKVEAGMIHISMNTSPVFPDGESEGSLMIVNEESNRWPQQVEILRNDTGESIYLSGAIPVGSMIPADKLDVPLAAGEYPCTAIFSNLDPETGEKLGSAGAIINIIIEN